MDARIITIVFKDGSATMLLLVPDGTWIEMGYSAAGKWLYTEAQDDEWVQLFIKVARSMDAEIQEHV